MSKDHIEKGMFLLGGSHPARYANTHIEKGMYLRGGEHPARTPARQ